MTRTLRNTAIVAVLLLIAACSHPIMNVSNESLNAPASATEKQVGDAIRQAGSGLGWVMKPGGLGKIQGTLLLRTHVAVVDIGYSKSAFSITYKDSTNLGYNGTSIHRNYNGWIQNLKNAIAANVSAI